MEFSNNVFAFVRSIPAGKVASYGQVARAIGAPRSARQVGFALRRLGLDEKAIPWWRVVNSKGFLSINHGEGGMEKLIQKDLLVSEGIEIGEDLKIDLDKYLWRG